MSRFYGYTGKILRISLSDESLNVENLTVEDARNYLGGRGFNAHRLYKEVKAGIDPLEQENKLMFATGPLVGTMFPTASRFNVSAKSPHTGIFGDSNAGGHFAPEMKFAGYDQIIIEGKSENPIYISVKDDEIEFRDAEQITGSTVFDADAYIKKDLADARTQTVICGPAAENGVKYGALFANQVRAASRTGMGTVMASKNVKALALRGTGAVEVAEPDRFRDLVLQLEQEIREHEQYQGRRLMGTTRILMMANAAGFLPTRNYLSGVYEHAAEVSGEKLAEKYNVKSRGCFACTIPCSRVYSVKNGPFKGLHGEGPEYESLGSFSSRIGNPDIELALKGNDLCNQLGLDILTVAGCIGWAMELYEAGELTKEETGGLELNWGNKEAFLTLIQQISDREGFGDILADGSVEAARKLGKGMDRTVQVKGMDLIMADPRGLKGFGLGYAVSSRGGDHLRSEPFIELSDDPELGRQMFGVPEATLRREEKGKGKLINYFEDWCAVIDALEPCKNIMQNMMLLPFEKAATVMEITTGLKLTPKEVREAGSRIINIERMFGIREGITRQDDDLPKRFKETPLTEGDSSDVVVNIEFMLDEYYTERGWDIATGHPTPETLRRLDLGFAVADLP
ncbi:MAG: aldehyde ferredoxin oxidoreductase family protein [Candidatus Bathyarchaeota archaeon]|nr:aldehyde ferredoxin oxidoreductase family protein [Candidatus Bathyarchaeota archaeon]